MNAGLGRLSATMCCVFLLCKFDISFGTGISKEGELLDLGAEKKLIDRPSISKIKAFLFIGAILCFNDAFKRAGLGHFSQSLSETFPLDVLVLPAKFSLTGLDIPLRKTVVARSYKIICHLKDNIRKFKVFNPACVNAIEADD